MSMPCCSSPAPIVDEDPKELLATLYAALSELVKANGAENVLWMLGVVLEDGGLTKD